MREADVSAQQPEAQENPRIPGPDADARRARGDPVPSSARPQATRRLIWRVRDRATFAALAQARPRRAGPVRIRAVPHRAGPPAVAYAVGRRAGSAVARNRLRRRLRAAVHERADLLSRDTAYLVGADPAALTMSFAALSDALARALPGPDPGSGGPVPHAPEPGR
jgi:ribonuclease P protein component